MSSLIYSPVQFLSEGYATHLSSLQFGHKVRSKKTSSMRMLLHNSTFGLSAKPDFFPKRTHLRRTMSVQQAELPKTLIPKPERSQSQPESGKDHKFGGGIGHGMFVLGGMHQGNTTPWPQREEEREGETRGKNNVQVNLSGVQGVILLKKSLGGELILAYDLSYLQYDENMIPDASVSFIVKFILFYKQKILCTVI